MNRFLITGGAGFIGGNYILKQLNSTNNYIINYDKLTYAGDITKFKQYQKNYNYKFIKGDICNGNKVADCLAQYKPDAILHFAAESHVDRSIEGAFPFIQTNIVGTYVLLEETTKYFKKLDAERKNQFRFLHVSTDEVFGELDRKNKFTEKSPYNPNSPYSASKAAADHLVRVWNRTYDLPTLITNSSNNYGPYQFPEKLIPLMLVNAISNKKLPIYGKGDNIRDWLYVEDHCQALYKVLDKGKIGEAYNIGGNCEKTNLEVVETICNILDEIKPKINKKSYKEQITFVKDRPGHDRRYALNCQKIKNELGWTPSVNFKQGLIKTIKWYLENLKWLDNISTNEYQDWLDKNYKKKS